MRSGGLATTAGADEASDAEERESAWGRNCISVELEVVHAVITR
jgi:hypothetical protein